MYICKWQKKFTIMYYTNYFPKYQTKYQVVCLHAPKRLLALKSNCNSGNKLNYFSGIEPYWKKCKNKKKKWNSKALAYFASILFFCTFNGHQIPNNVICAKTSTNATYAYAIVCV